MELHVGKRIAQVRQEMGLDQAEFARLVGMSQGRISQLENSPWVHLKTLQRIAERTGRDLSFFFLPPGEEETPQQRAVREERERFQREVASFLAFLQDLLGEWVLRLPPHRGIHLVERLLTLAQRQEGDWARQLQVKSLLALADLREALGEYTSARTSVEQALALAEQMGDEAARWACLYKQAVLDYRTGAFPRAAEGFREVAEKGPWPWRWRGFVGLSALAEQEGRLREAQEALEHAWASLSPEERRSPSLARLYIESSRVNLALAEGDLLRAEALARSALHTAEQRGDAAAALEERTNLALALLEQGQEEAAEEVLRQGLAAPEVAQDRRRWALAQSVLARSLARRQRFPEAEAAAQEALEGAEELKEPVVQFYAHWAAGEVERERRRWHRAYHHLQRAVEVAQRHRWPLYEARASLEMVPVLLELGEGEEARQRLEVAQRSAEAGGARSLEALAWALWAQWHRHQGQEEQALAAARQAWEKAKTLALAPLQEWLEEHYPPILQGEKGEPR